MGTIPCLPLLCPFFVYLHSFLSPRQVAWCVCALVCMWVCVLLSTSGYRKINPGQRSHNSQTGQWSSPRVGVLGRCGVSLVVVFRPLPQVGAGRLRLVGLSVRSAANWFINSVCDPSGSGPCSMCPVVAAGSHGGSTPLFVSTSSVCPSVCVLPFVTSAWLCLCLV